MQEYFDHKRIYFDTRMTLQEFIFKNNINFDLDLICYGEIKSHLFGEDELVESEPFSDHDIENFEKDIDKYVERNERYKYDCALYRDHVYAEARKNWCKKWYVSDVFIYRSEKSYTYNPFANKVYWQVTVRKYYSFNISEFLYPVIRPEAFIFPNDEKNLEKTIEIVDLDGKVTLIHPTVDVEVARRTSLKKAVAELDKAINETQKEMYRKGTNDYPKIPLGVAIAADIVAAPLALLFGGTIWDISAGMFHGMRKAYRRREKELKELREASSDHESDIKTLEPRQTTLQEPPKPVIPFYKKRIDSKIRIHKFEGEDFYDYCIYKDGLRNGIGITVVNNGITREGFFEDGVPCGQSVRYRSDGSKLVGVDSKGWPINGRFLRIYKDFKTHIETYKDGELVDVDTPEKDALITFYEQNNGTLYTSKKFEYSELHGKDGSITISFTNKEGLRFISKSYPDGTKVISQMVDGVQKGYCIRQEKDGEVQARLMDNLLILQTLGLDELDNGQKDLPWYQIKIDKYIKFHKYEGIDFYDISIYKDGFRNGVGIIYFKGDIKRTGFFKDGMTLGQSIREYPDGSKLIGVDEKGWSIEGRFLRIFKDYRNHVEIYKDGKLINTLTPNEQERLMIRNDSDGTLYYSKGFNYEEKHFQNNKVIKTFTNKEGLRLAVIEQNGSTYTLQFKDDSPKGFAIFEKGNESPVAKLFDGPNNVIKEIKLEEIDK